MLFDWPNIYFYIISSICLVYWTYGYFIEYKWRKPPLLEYASEFVLMSGIFLLFIGVVIIDKHTNPYSLIPFTLSTVIISFWIFGNFRQRLDRPHIFYKHSIKIIIIGLSLFFSGMIL